MRVAVEHIFSSTLVQVGGTHCDHEVLLFIRIHILDRRIGRTDIREQVVPYELIASQLLDMFNGQEELVLFSSNAHTKKWASNSPTVVTHTDLILLVIEHD